MFMSRPLPIRFRVKKTYLAPEEEEDGEKKKKGLMAKLRRKRRKRRVSDTSRGSCPEPGSFNDKDSKKEKEGKKARRAKLVQKIRRAFDRHSHKRDYTSLDDFKVIPSHQEIRQRFELLRSLNTNDKQNNREDISKVYDTPSEIQKHLMSLNINPSNRNLEGEELEMLNEVEIFISTDSEDSDSEDSGGRPTTPRKPEDAARQGNSTRPQGTAASGGTGHVSTQLPGSVNTESNHSLAVHAAGAVTARLKANSVCAPDQDGVVMVNDEAHRSARSGSAHDVDVINLEIEDASAQDDFAKISPSVGLGCSLKIEEKAKKYRHLDPRDQTQSGYSPSDARTSKSRLGGPVISRQQPSLRQSTVSQFPSKMTMTQTDRPTVKSPQRCTPTLKKGIFACPGFAHPVYEQMSAMAPRNLGVLPPQMKTSVYTFKPPGFQDKPGEMAISPNPTGHPLNPNQRRKLVETKVKNPGCLAVNARQPNRNAYPACPSVRVQPAKGTLLFKMDPSTTVTGQEELKPPPLQAHSDSSLSSLGIYEDGTPVLSADFKTGLTSSSESNKTGTCSSVSLFDYYEYPELITTRLSSDSDSSSPTPSPIAQASLATPVVVERPNVAAIALDEISKRLDELARTRIENGSDASSKLSAPRLRSKDSGHVESVLGCQLIDVERTSIQNSPIQDTPATLPENNLGLGTMKCNSPIQSASPAAQENRLLTTRHFKSTMQLVHPSAAGLKGNVSAGALECSSFKIVLTSEGLNNAMNAPRMSFTGGSQISGLLENAAQKLSGMPQGRTSNSGLNIVSTTNTPRLSFADASPISGFMAEAAQRLQPLAGTNTPGRVTTVSNVNTPRLSIEDSPAVYSGFIAEAAQQLLQTPLANASIESVEVHLSSSQSCETQVILSLQDQGSINTVSIKTPRLTVTLSPQSEKNATFTIATAVIHIKSKAGTFCLKSSAVNANTTPTAPASAETYMVKKPVILILHNTPPPARHLEQRHRNAVAAKFSRFNFSDLGKFNWRNYILTPENLKYSEDPVTKKAVKIGSGSFGTVFKGQYYQTECVVKLFNPHSSDNQGILKEARVMQHLQGTRVVPEFMGIIPLNQNDTFLRFGVVSEYIGEPTIRRFPNRLLDLIIEDTVRSETNIGMWISRKEWMAISYRLAHGLNKIHEKGILINDVKEDNILLRRHSYMEDIWCVYFIDFGLASFGTRKYNIDIPEKRRKKFGKKYPHIAPEIYSGGEAEKASDVYSLGVILDKMCKRFGLPISSIVRGCLRKEPSRRKSAAQLTRALKICLELLD